jgi:hypothetical protein
MLRSPTIRAALIAGMPWFDVRCPGRGTTRAIDLRTADRHPARLGRNSRARPPLLVLPRFGDDAEDPFRQRRLPPQRVERAVWR